MVIVSAMKALNGEFLFSAQISGNDLGICLILGAGEVEVKGIVFGVKVCTLEWGHGKIGNAALGKVIFIKKRFGNLALGPWASIPKSGEEYAGRECAAQNGEE